MSNTLAFDSPLTVEEEVALAEDVELEPELRRRVLVTHRALERIDHYALLGVERTADRKTIKRAYYDLAAKFHPDKYFRKKLGSFKTRLESVFNRITLAQDVLTSTTGRAEYDAYLEEQRRSRSIEDLLTDALAEAKRAEENIERQVREQEVTTGARPPGSPSGAPGVAAPPPANAPTPSASSPSGVHAAVRRDALARRLLGGRALPTSSVPPNARTSSSPAIPSTADAMDALRRRYEERLVQAKIAQARKYIAHGESALAAGDAVAAANAYRVAVSLSPDDPEVRSKATEAQAKADVLLSETYSRQAGYEEKNGQWSEAAKSWARVAKARPNDAASHERAANALVKAGGDLHEASQLAKQACFLEPKSTPFRLTLANVYIAAGMALNARRELETAAQLSPHDGTIQTMLKGLGKSA